VRSAVFLQLNSTSLALPSYSEKPIPRVEYNGGGLASVLACMALNDPIKFEYLVSVAKSLIPRLERIRFRKARVDKTERELIRIGNDTIEHRTRRPYQGDLILFDFKHAENVSALTASEGTMLILGLLTVLLGPTRPRIVLLDDIEHGLHPLAQKQLVEVIEKILVQFPDLQILATAHSPYLLNYVQPEQVRVMTTGQDGFARCGRLVDHPKFEKWKDEMAPGELWSIAVVHEAPADFEIATELADRVFLEQLEWLDGWCDATRTWLNQSMQNIPLTWTNIKRLALAAGVLVEGHFNGEPAEADAKAGRRAILYLMLHFPELAGIILVRDQDDQPNRKKGLEQARMGLDKGLPIVVGLAVAMREAWVISGFDPLDEAEQAKLEAEPQNIGFQPHFCTLPIRGPGRPDGVEWERVSARGGG
jgi:AAA domain, putative AbiEii toxin, Type IV TA system